MGKDFDFKSQICTDRFQSERLLALGLKKETADCNYPLSMIDGKPCQNCPRIGNPLEQNYSAFPAWSLHRLIEICNHKEQDLNIVIPYGRTYDAMIARVKWLIKEGYFNKEYLV